MSDVTIITIRDNGPLLVQGSVDLKDQEGNAIATKGEMIALCRCGSSSTKPFCDGTHATGEFDGSLNPPD
jgi:CDGSH-type Zn-finger protein